MSKNKIIRNRILAMMVSVSVVLAMVSSFALAEDFIGGVEDAEVTTTQPEETPEVGLEETEPEVGADDKSEETGTPEVQPEATPDVKNEPDKEIPPANKESLSKKQRTGVIQLDISNGSIEINEEGYRQASVLDESVTNIPHVGTYEITGTSSAANRIKVVSGSPKITINDLTISDDVTTTAFSPLSIVNDSEVELDVKGTNALTAAPLIGSSSTGAAGIEVSVGNSLTIIGDGSLSVKGGVKSAGIGGSDKQTGGNIKILGGTIEAKGGRSASNGYGGAGIGGGNSSSGGIIYIGGIAKVNAAGYLGGSGIGASGGTKAPAYTTQNITITDQAEVVAESGLLEPGASSMGAAIGGGYRFNGGNIEVSGKAQVTAISTDSGACLGGGAGSGTFFLDSTNILIKDKANVTAYGAGAVTCFGSGQGVTDHGTMTIEGKPTIFAYTYGKASGVYYMEDKTIAAALTNTSGSVVLKGYFNMTDSLAENGTDTYLEITTEDQRKFVVEYAGVNNQYYSDYVLITPSNGFTFKDDQNQPVVDTSVVAKDIAKVSYMDNTTLLKEMYSVKNGPAVKPTVATAPGKMVEGWYKESSLLNKWNFESDVVTADMSLYVNFTDEEYQIKYENLLGTTHNNPEIYTNASNITFVPPTSNATHYTFAGWYDGPGEEATKITGISAGSKGNITVYAHWKPVKYTVSYKGTDDTTLVADVEADYNTLIEKPIDPVKSGCELEGWYTDKELTTEWNFGSSKVAGNTILYAKWKQLVFEDNSGKIEFEDGQDDRWQFKIEQKQVDVANNIANIKAVYDIFFTLNNQRVEVKNKKMTITLNLKEEDQGFQNYKVVYMDNNGVEKERYNPTLINNGKSLQFEANHLSYYGIVAWNNAVNPGPPVNPDVPNIPDNPDTPDNPGDPDNPGEPDDPNTPNTPDEPSQKPGTPNQKADTPDDTADPENPQTGDNNNLVGLIGLLGISIAGLVIVVRLLNRREDL